MQTWYKWFWPLYLVFWLVGAVLFAANSDWWSAGVFAAVAALHAVLTAYNYRAARRK